MKIIRNPHDLYFKEVMSKVENARSFLENYLSDEIKRLLDIEHLEISKDSFIDEDQREHFSDMLDGFVQSPYAALCCTPIELRRIIIRLIHRCLHALPMELWTVPSKYSDFGQSHHALPCSA